MTLLYYYQKNEKKLVSSPDLKIDFFKPSFRSGFFLKGEQKNVKTFALRFLFQLQSFGKARIYYVISESNAIAHTSYVIPKCFKFPFMKSGDWEIGPCFTAPDFRGQGIYPKVISFICDQCATANNTLYMLVNKNNISSIRGIEKAGFKLCGSAKKTRLLKRYISSK